jgi:hypothetical protein
MKMFHKDSNKILQNITTKNFLFSHEMFEEEKILVANFNTKMSSAELTVLLFLERYTNFPITKIVLSWTKHFITTKFY